MTKYDNFYKKVRSWSHSRGHGNDSWLGCGWLVRYSGGGAAKLGPVRLAEEEDWASEETK